MQRGRQVEGAEGRGSQILHEHLPEGLTRPSRKVTVLQPELEVPIKHVASGSRTGAAGTGIGAAGRRSGIGGLAVTFRCARVA